MFLMLSWHVAFYIMYVKYIQGEAFNEVWLDDVHSDHPTSATTAIISSAAEDIRNTLVQYYSF